MLLVILILAMGDAFKKARLRKLKNVLPKTIALVTVENKGFYDMLEQRAKAIELKRDPFTAAPITSEKSLQSGVDLTGILWDKDKPLAIIDGDIVKIGARVGNKTVMAIKKDRVILSDGAVLSELKLE